MEQYAKELFNETWKLYKKYEHAESTDAVWESIIQEAEDLYSRFEHTPAAKLAAGMLTEILQYLDLQQTEQQARSSRQCA